MSIGPAEIIIVLVIALLVFGPSRLPQMGRSLGRGVREFKKAADTAKNELGLGEVTDQINEVKSTFTEPLKEVTGTFTDLKSSVDVKSAIEAPVAGTATAGAAGAAVVATTATTADELAAQHEELALAAASTPAVETSPETTSTPVVTPAPAQPLGVVDEGPETPAVTPATVFADVAPPAAPDDVEPPPAPGAPPVEAAPGASSSAPVSPTATES